MTERRYNIAMARIVIDARELRTSTGRYVERLLHYLKEIDHEHDYTVLLKPQGVVAETQRENDKKENIKRFTIDFCFTFC